MGLESEPVRIRATGAPTRCPFCHELVDRERVPWVACHACLAPHHSGCWQESGACAACGEARCVRADAPGADAPGAGAPGGGSAERDPDVATTPVERAPRDRERPSPTKADEPPVFDLELRGRHAHFEGPSAFELPVHTSRDDECLVRVRNETDAPRLVRLRELPAWLRPVGADSVEVPAHGSATLRLVHVAARTPLTLFGAPSWGTFVLATDDDARTVRLDVSLARDAARWRQAKLLLVGLVLVAYLAGYGTWSFQRREARVVALAQRGKVTQGRVTELTPHNHNQMYYSYEVNGVRYDRNTFASGQHVGDAVPVTYLPEDPDVSVLGGDFAHYALPARETLPLAAGMVAFMACAILFLQAHRGLLGASSGRVTRT